MSESRKYVAECPLCGTKFTDNPGECPVCGAAPLKPILETVAKARPIPVPTKRTLPPTAMRKRAKPSRPTPRPTPRPAPRPAVAPSAPTAKGRRLPPRGPDGRFLPFARAAPAKPRPFRTLEESREIRRKALASMATRIAALKAARKPPSPIRKVLRWLEEVFV